jgi:PPOX class probable F420-dependent enzyme
MKLNDAAREFIGDGIDANLVTINPDGSPQATVVWVALESTPDGDELVSAHLAEYRKTRNVRRDPRVAVTIVKPTPGQQAPYLAITGTARITEGGAPELLKKLATTMLGSDEHFPPPNSPPGPTHPHPDRQGRRPGPLGLLTANPLSAVAGLCHHARRHGGDSHAPLVGPAVSRIDDVGRRTGNDGCRGRRSYRPTR